MAAGSRGSCKRCARQRSITRRSQASALGEAKHQGPLVQGRFRSIDAESLAAWPTSLIILPSMVRDRIARFLTSTMLWNSLAIARNRHDHGPSPPEVWGQRLWVWPNRCSDSQASARDSCQATRLGEDTPLRLGRGRLDLEGTGCHPERVRDRPVDEYTGTLILAGPIGRSSPDAD